MKWGEADEIEGWVCSELRTMRGMFEGVGTEGLSPFLINRQHFKFIVWHVTLVILDY
jgi:hypothetical protein